MGKSKKMRKLIKAAKMEKPYAMYKLGLCYQLYGEDVQHRNQAAMWISSAADAGYAPAIEWMKDYSFDDSVVVQAES